MPIPPGSTIGILGGGQLGRMTAMAARTMGYNVHVLDPDANCSAAPVADRVVAAKTLVPVLGVPVPATMLNGLDSLLSIVQMPKGVPVGTLAIGEPGAFNAALLATAIVSTQRADVRQRLREWRQRRTDDVLANTTISAPG